MHYGQDAKPTYSALALGHRQRKFSLLIHLFFVLLAREVVRFEGLFRQFREFVGSEAEVVYTPIPVLKQRRYSSNSVFDALVKGYVGYGGTVLQ